MSGRVHIEVFDGSGTHTLAFESALTGWPEREPSWYVMRYRLDAERALLRVLRLVDLEYALLTFEHRVPKHAGEVAIRRWFPGYLFVRFDEANDRWQQLYRAPGMIEFLGKPSPIDEAAFYDLRARCTPTIDLDGIPRAEVPVGSTVEVLEGPMRGHRGVVSASAGDNVTIELVVFARITSARVSARSVIIMSGE